MKLAYQVAMPDLESSPLLTAYQGSLEDSFRHLAENGYQGIELMVRDPQKLDPELLNRLTSTYGLEVVMLATGEIWAQDHISLSSSNPENRLRCIKRFKEFIDCAAPYHAQVNIGRVRGRTSTRDPAGNDSRSCRGCLSPVGQLCGGQRCYNRFGARQLPTVQFY